MKISRNTVATLSFTALDGCGQVVGRTDPKAPMTVLVGHGALVRGLEKAIDGHEAGDEFSVTLNPADAYGQYDERLVQEIDKAMFKGFKLEVGQLFEADSQHGPVGVVVKEIKENTVVVDSNHPLAGKTLTFLVKIEDVRKATEEEIAHGHVHHNGVCPSDDEDAGAEPCSCGHHHHDGHCCHHHDEHEHEHEAEHEHHCHCSCHQH